MTEGHLCSLLQQRLEEVDVVQLAGLFPACLREYADVTFSGCVAGAASISPNLPLVQFLCANAPRIEAVPATPAWSQGSLACSTRDLYSSGSVFFVLLPYLAYGVFPFIQARRTSWSSLIDATL